MMDAVNTIEMILMTKSSKYGDYCVAGFEMGSGRSVRLISSNGQTHGAISKKMLYDPIAKRCAEVLDRVRVPIIEQRHGRVQTENVLIDETLPIRILGRVRIEEAMMLHPCEDREGLFFSHRNIVEGDAEALGHSLEFVKAQNIRIYKTYTSGGSIRHKIDFDYAGSTYQQFAMTDPQYYGEGNRQIPQAALMLSISEDEWSRRNGHHIFTAAIFELGAKARRRKGRRPFLRRLLAAVLLCAVIGICAALCSAERVWIPPYSGARYHTSRQCIRLQNPEAAYRLPVPLARLFCVPCGECTASQTNDR